MKALAAHLLAFSGAREAFQFKVLPTFNQRCPHAKKDSQHSSSAPKPSSAFPLLPLCLLFPPSTPSRLATPNGAV